MRTVILAIALLLLPTTARAQSSERKVALIVANSTYVATSKLINPGNDALIVADAARRAGFEVTSLSDAELAGFQRALRDFRAKADGAQVAMVYYAGHGIEGAGKNWLIPVDAQLGSDLDLPYEAIDLDRVMESISGAKVRMVVLDACRNNPFGRSWRSATRAVQRGLAGIEVDDVLVIYAAGPGQTAADGDGANSPFASSLAKRLIEPGLPIQLLGGAVRDDVLAATGGNQRPYVSASITGTPIYLVPRERVLATAEVTKKASAPTSFDIATLDALGWQGALSAQSIAGFEAYLKEFPTGRFATLAQQNITRLRAAVGPTAAVGNASAPNSELPGVDSAEYGYKVGLRLWEARNFSQAEKELKWVIESNPGQAIGTRARHLLGRVYLDDGKPRSAAETFLKNYREDPRSGLAPDSLLLLGIALHRLGQDGQACRALDELAAVYPTQTQGRLAQEAQSARRDASCPPSTR